MKLRMLVMLAALTAAGPAFAECSDDVCGSIKKILEASSGNFSKLKGKPGLDARGDPIWAGTQAIPGLMSPCSIYKRGEGAHYEYHCETAGGGTNASLSPEKAKQIAAGLKAAIQSADPKIVWFDDPTARALGDIDGFKGTEGWYGGYAKNKLLLKIEVVVSEAAGSTTGVTIFAKPLVRRDVK